MKLAPLAALAAALAVPAAAAPPRPRLIVAVSMDQFSGDLFREYRPYFTAGLKRLSSGIVFARGFQAHAATETCPGHSTLLTGMHPGSNGIIANNWIDAAAPRADKEVYCSEDESRPGTSSSDYVVSDVHLRVPALGDRMKAADPRSLVAAVAGKDRSAVMMGGHGPDQRWYWAKDRFATMQGRPPSKVDDAVNANVAAALAAPRPALTVPDHCRSKDVAVPIGGGKTVGAHKFDRAAGDVRGFVASPEFDGATLALAAGLVQEMELGTDDHPDLLAIGLSATDYVGHRYGPGGVEMCLQLAAVDRDLGDFFAFLDGRGIDYAVVLSADHGGLDIPERTRNAGQPDAARIDPAIMPAAVGRAIAARLGLSEPAIAGDWYVAPSVPPARRAEVLALARQMLTAHPQVEAVFTADEIARLPMPTGRAEDWTIAQRMRASFDPARSGNLLVALKPHITPIPDPTVGYVSTHGSVWDYDRNVPITFWWRGAPAQDRTESAMTVDIMPTLASLIGVPVTDRIDGRCLDLVPGPDSNCVR